MDTKILKITETYISFDQEDAIRYGDKCALMITYLQFCINQSKRNEENIINGKTWMVQTIDQITESFPLNWNRGKIRRVIEKLVDFNVIVKGNFNKNAHDRTNWYAFNDERFLND